MSSLHMLLVSQSWQGCMCGPFHLCSPSPTCYHSDNSTLPVPDVEVLILYLWCQLLIVTQDCYQPVTDLFRALHNPHAQVAGACRPLQQQHAREMALSNLLQVCAC